LRRAHRAPGRRSDSAHNNKPEGRMNPGEDEAIAVGNGEKVVALPTVPARAEYQFKFTGSGGEYFRIWIVNLLLSIVTVGIYSAWAKVRKKRYFYGNTWVAESNFEFHGSPIAILKGRIIAVIALAAYSAASYLSPKLGQVLFLLLVAVSPWFIARTFAFNAHNSSYRQIRFRNTAVTKEVFFAIWPFLLVAATALLLSPDVEPGQTSLTALEWIGILLPSLIAVVAYPYVFGAVTRLHVNRSFYGGAPFSIDATLGRFYKVYLKAYLIFLLAIAMFGMLAALIVWIPVLGMFGIVVAYFIAGAAMLGYVRSRIGNLIFNTAKLEGGVDFHCHLSAVALAKLYFTNLLAITVSVGLLIPWAAVRVARYRAECLSLRCDRDLESYLAARGQDVAATGEEVGEFFDVDLSL
jgi:uncharacterized membrane protein YjgN (DUF898 family)